jgi:hypothetical protein
MYRVRYNIIVYYSTVLQELLRFQNPDLRPPSRAVKVFSGFAYDHVDGPNRGIIGEDNSLECIHNERQHDFML